MNSVSELPRLDACPSSATLQHVRTASVAATDGTAIHRFMELALTHGRDVALAEVPAALRERCLDLDVAGIVESLGASMPLKLADVYAEVAVAWNPTTDTSRIIGQNRDYRAAHPHELVGTADLCIATEDAVIVPDWKTGQQMVEHATTNLQARAYTMMWARAVGRSNGVAAIVALRDGAAPYVMRSDLGPMELDGVAGRIRDVLARVEKAKATPLAERTFHEGDHCRYCPGFASCPAKAGAAQGLVPVGDRLPELTPTLAGSLITKLDAYDAMAARMRAHLEEYARTLPEGVPLGDGTRLVEREKEGNRVVDPAIGSAVLAEAGLSLPPPEKLAVGAIEKAAGGKKAGAAILATIEARGGITRPVSRKLVVEKAE